MKQALSILIATVAASMLIACTKSGNALRASIIGTWEMVSSQTSFTDKNGNPTSARDVIVAMYKANGMTDEQIAAMSSTIDVTVSAMESGSQTAGMIRYHFENDGRLKTSVKTGESWGNPIDSGSYQLDGDRLTLKITGGGQSISTVYTILNVNDKELILQVDSSKVSGSGVTDIYAQLGYKTTSMMAFRKI